VVSTTGVSKSLYCGVVMGVVGSGVGAAFAGAVGDNAPNMMLTSPETTILE
jgi:hypothetical protein